MVKHESKEYDVIIIGAGPAGYVAAIRAGQVGLKTLLVEKGKTGGMCLNWGCIPSKVMLESAKYYARLKQASDFGIDGIDTTAIRFNFRKAKERATSIVKILTGRIEQLLEKNGVTVIQGTARIVSEHYITVNSRTIETRYMIIATGSFPEKLSLKTKDKSVVDMEFFSGQEEIPDHIVVAGTGPVAIETAQFYNLIDKKVTLVIPDKNLIPSADRFLVKYVINKLKADGIEIIEEAGIKGYEKNYLLAGNRKIRCDRVINCNRRRAVIPPSDIEFEFTDQGFLQTNDYLQTRYPTIYAAGDVNGRSYFAHAASSQGHLIVNHIRGIKEKVATLRYPVNIYTSPEIAQAGYTEEEIKNRGMEYKVNVFSLSGNGKALAEGQAKGFIRILSEKKYGEVLGVQIVAPHATDMISEALLLMQMEGSVYDLANTIHAHPTISEVFADAVPEAAVEKMIRKEI